MSGPRTMASDAPRRRAVWRAWVVPAAITTLVVALSWAHVRSEDPDDRLFHPRFTLRVIDEASGAPVVGAQVWATRSVHGRKRAVPIWPHDPRAGGSFGGVAYTFTDAKGEVEVAAEAAAEGCTVNVGGMPTLFAAVFASIHPRRDVAAPDDAEFAYFETLDHVTYDEAHVRVVDRAPAVIRLRRTPLGTATVRRNEPDRPPASGVCVTSGRCDDPTAGHRHVEGFTDENGIVRFPLPTRGTLKVFVGSSPGEPSDCSPGHVGSIDRAHPALDLLAPPRPMIRLRVAAPIAGTVWSTHGRRHGCPDECALGRSAREDEATVEPLDLTGRYDVFVDGGDKGGRALIEDVAAPSNHDVAPARGPRIRVTILGTDRMDTLRVNAYPKAWDRIEIPGILAAGTTFVLSSLPPGRYRVVVCGPAEQNVGIRSLDVDVGDAVVERTVDVSKD